MFERVLDRAAVLALESRDLCQSVFNLREPFGREGQSVEEVAQCRRQVFEHCARRAETFEVVFIRGLVLRQLFNLSLQTPQTRDRRVALLVSQVVRARAKLRQLLKVDETPTLRLKPFVLARGEARGFEFAHLKAQSVRHVKLLGLVASQGFEFTTERRPASEARRHFFARGCEVCEGVEQFEVRVGVKQCLLRALPVYVNEERPQRSQKRERRQTVVDEDAPAPFGRKLAAHDQLNVAAPCADARLFQYRLDLRVRAQSEQSLDRCVGLARAYHLRREAVADEHAERVNDD